MFVVLFRIYGLLQVLFGRQGDHLTGHLFLVEGQPGGNGTLGNAISPLLEEVGTLHRLSPGYNIAYPHQIGWDVRFAPVYQEMAVVNHLPGLLAGIGEPQEIDHIIQPALQGTQQVHAADTGVFERLGHVAPDEIGVHPVQAEDHDAFAARAPALLVVFGGIAESGLIFRAQDVATNAAREGARMAALPGNEQDNYAIVVARVNAYLADAGMTGPRTITVVPETMTVGALTANGARVNVSYTYQCLFLGPVLGLINGTFANTLTFQSTALMRVQVPAVSP